jgi:hypothetical protein
MTFDTEFGRIQVVTGYSSPNYGEVWRAMFGLGSHSFGGQTPPQVHITGRYLGPYVASDGASYETVEAYSISEGTGSPE